MSDKNRDEIIDKIRKLNAMAESAADIGSEAEAQAFAAKVQQLLTDYKLSSADIKMPKEQQEPINMTRVRWQDLDLDPRKTRVVWTEELAHLVCRTYYCDFIISRGHGSIGLFIGAETDRKIAVFMYVTIGRFLYKLAEREDRKFKYDQWVKAGKPSTGAIPGIAHGFKAGFIHGFITRLRERFEEEIRPKDKVDESRTTAIVLVRKDSLDRVRSWEKDNMNLRPMRSLTMDGGNREGQQRGKDAANAIDLQAKSVERTGKTIHQVKG